MKKLTRKAKVYYGFAAGFFLAGIVFVAFTSFQSSGKLLASVGIAAALGVARTQGHLTRRSNAQKHDPTG